MNTKPKRKYGNIRQGAETSAGTNEEVFEKFFSRTVAPDATVPPRETVAPEETVAPPATVAPEPALLSPETTVAPQATVAPNATVAPDATVVKGYFDLTNDLTDRILPTLDPYEQVVLLRLCRLAWGFKSDRCKVGYKRLIETCNVGKRKLAEAVAMLERRELVRRLSLDQGGTERADRGTTYEILLAPPPGVSRATVARKDTVAPHATVARGMTNKDKALNDTNKGLASPDVKNCPDCQGTYWLYPNGPQGGVVRCQHPNLKLLPD